MVEIVLRFVRSHVTFSLCSLLCNVVSVLFVKVIPLPHFRFGLVVLGCVRGGGAALSAVAAAPCSRLSQLPGSPCSAHLDVVLSTSRWWRWLLSAVQLAIAAAWFSLLRTPRRSALDLSLSLAAVVRTLISFVVVESPSLVLDN
jgi:hypothetical protein